MKHPSWPHLLRQSLAASLFLLTGCIPQTQWWGTGSITGAVADSLRNPIHGATVRVLHTSPARGGITRSNGRFNIAGLAPGQYTLQVTAPGYHRDSVTDVGVAGDRATEVEKILRRTSDPLPSLPGYTIYDYIRHPIPRGSIRINITDTLGRRIYGRVVEIFSHWDKFNEVPLRNEDFLMEYIGEGKHDLHISHPHYYPDHISNIVVADDSISRVEVRLRKRSDLEIAGAVGMHPYVPGRMGTIRATHYDSRGRYLRP